MIITYNNIEYEVSDKYSFKDFTGQDLSDRDDLSNIVIYRSCFSQESLDRHIFPLNIEGLTLINCNLDNCYIPESVITIDCSNRRFKAQEDGYDWLVDENNNPIERL